VLGTLRRPGAVYTREGKLVKSWGQDEFKSPHSVRFDGQGNVWITDHAAHVVKKFTPEGKLLLTLGTPASRERTRRILNGPTDTAITPAVTCS